MKNKISKIFLALFSVFLLVGGGIFSACGKEQPQATIEVSSSDFAGDDYIEIDLGSSNNTATITAKVTGASAGIVSVNNDYQDKIATSAVYDSKTESTVITIVGKSEGNAELILKSHGNGQRIIRVYVYSDILALDPSDELSEQYVVRGQSNILNPDKLLKFTSRPNGESNRKNVTWSLKTQDENLSIDGNVLTVGEDYQKFNTEASVEVYADSVYVDKRATIKLNVISPLPDFATYISRTSDAQGTELTEAGQAFNLVKNNDLNEEASLYARLVVPVSSKLNVTPKVYDAEGRTITDKLDITLFNSRIISNTNEIIYLIKAKSQIIEPQKLTVCFDVAYEKYSYTKESTKFTVDLVDVIDRIDVKSNNLSITKNESINVYDYYNNDSSYQFGHPFYVALGPDTVANSLAKYFVQVTIPAGRSINGTVLLSDQFGNPISFGEKIDSTALGDVYRSQPINNKTVVYLIAGNAFTNGDEIDCVFMSQQSESVNLPIKIRLYNSPKDNFDIDGGDLEYYLSTNKHDRKIVEISSSSLMGIDKAGVKLSYEENDKIKVSNYQFDSETGKISFTIENLALNLSGNDAKLAIKVEHKNGFVSKQEIIVSAFIPLKNAHVNYQGQSTTAVAKTEYGKQNFNSTNVEGEGDNTLTRLVLKTGSTVSMTFNSNCNANVAFKFVKGVNLDTIEDENAKLQELINATEDTSVNNPLANAGRMTMPSVDVKGYALVTFTGYDEDHQEITFYRYFALEGYTSPTRLTANVDEKGVELFAADSISSEDTQLSTSRITIRYRTDGLPVTYFGNGNGATVNIDCGNTISISNENHTNETISFDVTALTTNGYSAWEDQILVSYKVFNSVYFAQIHVSIKNAQRVEKVVYTNQNPDDGIIYLDVNGTTSNERNAVILTSVTPSNAYNQELRYIFVADSGTQSDLVSVNELGAVSFKAGARVGGTGYIYVLPKDAIRNIDGAQGINYYVDGDDNVKNVLLTEIATKYDEITTKGYFKGKILDKEKNIREKIYYKDSLLKIRVVVADGASEETATRIYNANSLKNIDLNRHYELMNSISLDSKWTKLAGTLNGTLRGHNSNVTIRFNGGGSIFENIGKEAKVYNLNLAGNVKGSGMLAQTNEGSISNVNVVVYSEGATIKSSTITGKGYVGGIVGINKGTIQDSAVEGATIVSDSGAASLSDIAGGIAGQNSGKILNSKVEFYNIDKVGGINIVNTFKAFYVGGIVGELTEGATIEKSYAYNYSNDYPLSSVYPTITEGEVSKTAASGAIVGKAIGGSVTNSFAILSTSDAINWAGENAAGLKPEDAYWGYNDEQQTKELSNTTNPANWIKTTDKDFKSYVREGKAHLTFYQAQAISEGVVNGFVVKDVSQSNSAKALAITKDASGNPVDNQGLLFIKSLKDSSGLDDGERSSLRALNTISVAKLLGISDENVNKIVISSDSNDITIDGKNIILLNRSDEVTITVSSKYDFTIKKQFTFKIIYAVDEFTIWHDGIETSGFTLQEGRPDGVSFTIKDFVYIGNSGNKFEIKLEDFEITPSLEIIEGFNNGDQHVEFETDGMTASILAKRGTKDFLATKSKEFFEAYVQIDLKNVGGEYKAKVQEFTKKTLQIYPTKGAQTIRVPVDQINIEPAYQSNLNVVLVTDDNNDQLNLSLAFGDTVLSKKQTGNIYTFSLNGTNRIQIVAVAQDYDSTNALINYALTITVCDEYRSQISESENYTLSLTSQSGTADNEPVNVNITLSTQMINNIDMTNYKAGTTLVENGVVYYSHGTETISVISPGRNTMMQVAIDPTFAYYDHMTLTFENADGAILGITALDEGGTNGYRVDYSAVQIDGGVRLARRASGNYNFRLYAAANITTDTVFYVVASFFDKNNNLVVPAQRYELYVSYLPEAEITVNGDISAVVAKGGSLDLVMLLKSDQEIESLVANNVRGITISPQSTWTIEDNGNGTKTMRAKLYAGLNAGIKVTEEKNVDGIKVTEEKYVNGEFALTAVVSRIFNGAREEKRSSAYITIVDFLPEKATIKNAREKDNSSNLVLDSYIGIPVAVDFDYTFNPEEYGYDHSSQDDITLVNSLIQARQEFEQKRYYANENAGFYINYDKESNQVIPITQRIKVGNQMARFVQSSEDENVWTFNYTKFRLNYNSKTNMLTVLGLSSTASPVTVTLIDEIYVASSGKAIKYTIETPFAIDVVTYSDADLPLLIRDEEEFLKVANEGTAQNYILLNDITLKNYTPISANMFKMLDGNGYSINIESFNMEGSGTLNLALFTSIPATTTIKNLKVNYYNGGKINVDTTSSGYTSINVAGLAITNAGIVTNTQVIAYQNADAQIIHNNSVGLQVNLMRGSTPYYIDDNSSVKAQIAGFVLTNTGSITNSRVGGESIVVIGDQIGDTNYTYYSNVALNQFVLSGQGDMAGFVLTNSGSIVASGASNIQITNLSTAAKTSTAGFAVANGGNIRTSYVEGSKDPSEATQYHLKGSSIISKGTVAGFVVNNTANGVIANAYSNIFISNSAESQSRTSAGFVYKNEGKIAYSYSASRVEKANILQTNFSGVDSNGNSLNLGKIELSYYYIQDYADDTSEDIQGAIENQATLINKDAVNSENAYYGFIFSSSTSLQDGLWKIDADAEEGVKLICRNEVTVSHRYYFSISEDEYALPYSILRNQENTAGVEYNTELGNDCNPILISNANEFKEAMGESKSIYVQKFYNKDKVFGAYRFVSDIMLSDLNNELGNAEVKSIDKIFAGKLDGNGFTIKNISIKSSNNSVGLFGEINSGIVRGVNLEVDNITASNSYTVGALTGLAKNSIISNVALTQKTVTSGDSNSGKGVLGRNITGGIIGSAFGDCYITGLTSTDVIVQSSFYNDAEDRYNTYLNNTFNSKTIRQNENQLRARFFSSDAGIGSVSFAGGVIGYSDTYLTNEISSLEFVYGQNLNDSRYAIKKLVVNGSVDVRGEVVGGVIGFTGINTKAKDISLTISKGDGFSNNLLSYNGFAGSIVGYANGQFHQVYAEHDEKTQDLIETSTKNYYKDGNAETERGELALFKFKEASTGAYKYEPVYVGGLMGVMDAGAITVAYSKINAINHSATGYAGGIAGLVKDSSQFTVSVESLGQTAKTSLLLNEVYASGDVYANGEKVEEKTVVGFAGLFGKLYEESGKQVKLTMMSVNAVNHYGIVGNSAKYKNGIYAIASNANATNVQVFPAVVATDGLAQGDIASAKSFGYMSDYSPKDANDNVKVIPYEGFVDADYFFKITAVTSFTSSEDGYTETNGAFINSNAWDSDNWTHKITDLYPRINLINKLNYIYLDVYNKVSVVAKMQNSSIEVRVRGKKSVNENVYENVDLTDIIGAGIQNYSGKLVGGTDGTWGTGFGPITLVANKPGGYPGIIINNTLFASTGSGVSISNLNIIVRNDNVANQITTSTGSSTGTGSDSGIGTNTNISVTGGLISRSEVVRGKFENVKLHVSELINITPVVVGTAGYAGLLVPSANSTSFRNITINFFGPDNAVMVSANNDTTTNTINAGLLAGSIVQASKYEAVKIQDISIRQNNRATNPIMLLKVDRIKDSATSGETNNVGLYVGSITSASEGNVAAVVLSAKAPDVWDGTTPVNENGVQSIIEVTGTSGLVNFGGYYGSVQAAGTTLTLYKEKDYVQKLKLSNAVATSQLNEGGLIGDAALQSFTIINQTGNDEKVVLNTELEFSQDQSDTNIGSMFGHVSGTFTIDNTFGGVQAKITTVAPSESSTKPKLDPKIGNGVTYGLGGIIGKNEANLTIRNLKVKLAMGDQTNTINWETSGISSDSGGPAVGGVIGANSGIITTDDNSNIEFNNLTGTSNGRIAIQKPTYYGNFVGHNIGSISINTFKTNALIEMKGTEVVLGAYGGIVGYTKGNVDIEGNNTTKSVKVNSTFNITCGDAQELSIGGVIGKIDQEHQMGSSEPVKITTLNNIIFSGAFNLEVSKAKEVQQHNIGGLIGKIEAAMEVSLTSNLVYGDVIYTYSNAAAQLSTYHFGGLIGQASMQVTTDNNIIAFTNNNSRKAVGTTSVNAICGNRADLGASSDVYCSQLVLATNDHATDLGYYEKNTNGYKTTDGEKTIIDKATQFDTELTTTSMPDGHKFKPITSGEAKTTGLNGITYYTTKYPNVTDATLTSAAFIGDFKDFTTTNGYSPIDVVGQKAFVSGVVIDCNISDTDTTGFTDSVGGIAKKLQDGIIFACKATGKLSVGGTTTLNVGGIVGLMQTGRIAECYSSVDIVYRAGKNGDTLGTAAAIAVTNEKDKDDKNAINFIENTYATGEVASYISANLYAFTNGANAFVQNSYTISHISAKDHTSIDMSSNVELGIFGSAETADCAYDKNGTEYNTNNVAKNSNDVGATVTNFSYYNNDIINNSKDKHKFTKPEGQPKYSNGYGWVADIDNNYGYMRRNFKAFESSSSEKIGDITYLLIPNATKLYQMTNDTTASPVDSSYKLIRDIDLSKTTYNNKSAQPAIVISGKTFEGDNHTIKNVTATLFSNVATLNNLRVTTVVNGASGITGSAVVATNVGTATNVVATGILTGDATTVGGLFATATGALENCKNYVKIDVSGKNGAKVGGIAGVGASATYCINYSPINVEGSTGSYVGGIFGQVTSAISYCGNENTVFNGYANTSSDGDYYAAGIVGDAGEKSVSNCYNTAMIKAGNKNINASGETKAYAAGIVADGTKVSTCYNSGHIEALGSLKTALNGHSLSNTGYNVTFKFNQDKENVQAGAMTSNGANKNANNAGTIFMNGYHKVNDDKFSVTVENAALENDSKDDTNGLKITSTQTPSIAAIDEMGVPKSFFVTSERKITYPGNKTKTQKRYTNTQKKTTYYDCSISKGVDANNQPVDVTDDIKTIRGNIINQTQNAGSGNEKVDISGKTYMFVSLGGGFAQVANSTTRIQEIIVSGETKLNVGGGKTISVLYAAGYTFRASDLKITSGGKNASNPNVVQQAHYDTNDDKLKFTVAYDCTPTDETQATLSYQITAEKANGTITIDLVQSNIFAENGNTVIYLEGQKDTAGNNIDISGLTNGQEYTLTVNEKPKFKYASETKTLSCSGNIVDNLKGKSATINLNEGKTTNTAGTVYAYSNPEGINEEIQLDTSDSAQTETRRLYTSVRVRNGDEGDAVMDGVQVIKDRTYQWNEKNGKVDKHRLRTTRRVKGKVNSVSISSAWGNHTFTIQGGGENAWWHVPQGLHDPFYLDVWWDNMDGEGYSKVYFDVQGSANLGDEAQTRFANVNITFNLDGSNYNSADEFKDSYVKTTANSSYEKIESEYQKNGDKVLRIASYPTSSYGNTSINATDYYYYQSYKLTKVTATVKAEETLTYTFNDEVKTVNFYDDTKTASFGNISYNTTQNTLTRTSYVYRQIGYTVNATKGQISNSESCAVLYERVLKLISQNAITSNSADSTITIGSTKYTYELTGNAGDANRQLAKFNGAEVAGEEISVGGATYLYAVVGDGLSLYQQFIGDKGNLVLSSVNTIKYGLDENGEIKIVGHIIDDTDEIYTVKIGENTYTVSTGDKVISTQPKSEDNNGQTTIYFDSGINAFSYIVYSVDIKVADDYKTFNLVNQKSEAVLTEQEKNFLNEEEIEQTIDGQTISYSDNKISVSEGRASGARSVNLIYLSGSNTIMPEEINIHAVANSKANIVKNIVLKKDVDVGYIASSYSNSGFDGKISGDGYIINYTSKNASLFNEVKNFVKNLSVAGSIITDGTSTTSNYGMLAKTISTNIKNISTYGSISDTTTRTPTPKPIKTIKAGGIAYEINANAQYLNNFVSYSAYGFNSTDDNYGMTGIMWNKGTNEISYANNYGTIIGFRGKDGADGTSTDKAGGNGVKGQNVYAISSQNVTYANNYGIVKAGDGGNGGRGADGVGSGDTANGETPGVRTSQGDGGKAGSEGKAYIAEAKIINGNSGNPGKGGVAGNEAWIGLNFKFFHNSFRKEYKYLGVEKDTWYKNDTVNYRDSGNNEQILNFGFKLYITRSKNSCNADGYYIKVSVKNGTIGNFNKDNVFAGNDDLGILYTKVHTNTYTSATGGFYIEEGESKNYFKAYLIQEPISATPSPFTNL